MENKKLKWYNYAAKVVMILLLSPAAPILILIALASGESPLYMYKIMWYDGKPPNS